MKGELLLPTGTTESDARFAPLDEATARLCQAAAELPGFSPRPLPPGLASLKGVHGGAPLEARCAAFSAEGLRWGRLVRVDGPATFILNAVAVPDDGFVTPILSLELLAFRGRAHLVVADLFPLVPVDEAAMDELGRSFEALGEPQPLPPSAPRILSRSPLFRRPASEAAIAEAARAVCEVSSRWARLASERRHASGDAEASEAARRRDDYLAAHLDDESVAPFLGRAFGEEAGARLVGEVMFPLGTTPWSGSATP